MSVQLEDYFDSIIVFLFGLFIGIVTTYLGHLWSMRRTKKEEFSPYLTKLYGIVSRIMRRTDAEYLKTQYNKVVDATVNEKMRELAIKELTQGKASQMPMPMPTWFSSTFSTFSAFLMSFTGLIEVAKECRDFESVYTEMEKKGLVQALKLRDKRLSGHLNTFYQSAKYVSEETSGIVEELEKLEQTGEPVTTKQLEFVFQGDALQKLLELATHNLFHFGSQLEKELEKHV